MVATRRNNLWATRPVLLLARKKKKGALPPSFLPSPALRPSASCTILVSLPGCLPATSDSPLQRPPCTHTHTHPRWHAGRHDARTPSCWADCTHTHTPFPALVQLGAIVPPSNSIPLVPATEASNWPFPISYSLARESLSALSNTGCVWKTPQAVLWPSSGTKVKGESVFINPEQHQPGFLEWRRPQPTEAFQKPHTIYGPGGTEPRLNLYDFPIQTSLSPPRSSDHHHKEVC